MSSEDLYSPARVTVRDYFKDGAVEINYVDFHSRIGAYRWIKLQKQYAADEHIQRTTYWVS